LLVSSTVRWAKQGHLWTIKVIVGGRFPAEEFIPDPEAAIMELIGRMICLRRRALR